MLRQLIRDYLDQVARKKSLIKQTEDEINVLESRIQQFEELIEGLTDSTEETA